MLLRSWHAAVTGRTCPPPRITRAGSDGMDAALMLLELKAGQLMLIMKIGPLPDASQTPDAGRTP